MKKIDGVMRFSLLFSIFILSGLGANAQGLSRAEMNEIMQSNRTLLDNRNNLTPSEEVAQNAQRPAGQVPSGNRPNAQPPQYNDSTGDDANNSSGMFQAVELGVQYPFVLGQIAQNFKGALGFHAAIEVEHFLDEDVRHFIYAGYQNLGLMADSTSSFRIVPILFFLGISGKSPIGISTTFDIGAGGAIGWINVPNSVSFQMRPYFTAVAQPGIEIALADGLNFFLRSPITYIIGSKSLGYLAYDAGLKLNF